MHNKSILGGVSCSGRHFYGTENESWAGFGPVDNNEKKMGGQL